MTAFTLVVRPDGRAILTCSARLSEQMRTHLIEHLREWDEGRWPIAVLDDCTVIQVGTVEIDLGEGAALDQALATGEV